MTLKKSMILTRMRLRELDELSDQDIIEFVDDNDGDDQNHS